MAYQRFELEDPKNTRWRIKGVAPVKHAEHRPAPAAGTTFRASVGGEAFAPIRGALSRAIAPEPYDRKDKKPLRPNQVMASHVKHLLELGWRRSRITDLLGCTSNFVSAIQQGYNHRYIKAACPPQLEKPMISFVENRVDILPQLQLSQSGMSVAVGEEPIRRARRNDPSTSKEAAAKAERFAKSHSGRILFALQGASLTAHEIGLLTGLQVVQVDRRTVELQRAGRIQVVQENGQDATRDGFRIWEAIT